MVLDSSQQEQFAQLVSSGVSQSDAYRQAFNTASMLNKTIWECASRLAADSKVSARIQELREAIASEFVANQAWDLQELLTQYQQNVIGARQDKQWAASNGALNGYGKASGLVVERTEVDVTHTIKPGLSLEELEARYRRLEALEAGMIVDGTVTNTSVDSDEDG